MISQALLPRSNAQMIASSWLDTYCRKFGDYSPENNVINVPAISKKHLWTTYKEECKEEITIQFTHFIEIWNSIYPNCVLREEVNIVGKCWTCYKITDMRSKSTDKNVLEACKILHLYHGGGCFKRERDR